MATRYHNFSGTVTATVGFSGDGSLLTALARSHVATGTADHVLINGATGLMSSEVHLAVSRGGLGTKSDTAGYWDQIAGNVDPKGSLATMYAVLPGIIGTDVGLFSSVGAAVGNVPYSLVIRDSSGNITSTNSYYASYNTEVTNVTYPATHYQYNLTNIYNSNGLILQCYQRTTSTEQVQTLAELIAPGSHPTNTDGDFALSIKGYVTLATASATSYGTYEFYARAYYVHTTTWQLQTPPILQETKNFDADLALASVTLTVSGTALRVTINQGGATPLHVDWAGVLLLVWELVRTD
jgi:hypothetical protein